MKVLSNLKKITMATLISVAFSGCANKEPEGKLFYQKELGKPLIVRMESDGIHIVAQRDLPARFDYVSLTSEGVLRAAATDYGINKGIRQIRLYEDGKFKKRWENMENGIDPRHNPQPRYNFSDVLKGTHEYFFRVEDKGGNVTQSESITVHIE